MTRFSNLLKSRELIPAEIIEGVEPGVVSVAEATEGLDVFLFFTQSYINFGGWWAIMDA